MKTEQLIYNTALSDGMPDKVAGFMVAQSKLESGNYKHRFFTIGKNAFGYSADKNSKWQIKPGSKADNGIPIAQYATIQDSVHEVTSWIKRRQKEGKFPKDLTEITTIDKYGSLLFNARYGGRSAKEYINGMKVYLKIVAGEIKKIPPVIPLLFVLVALYFIIPKLL